MKNSKYGFYNILLGVAFKLRARKYYKEYDDLAGKDSDAKPRLPVMMKSLTLTKDVTECTAETCGFRDLEHYKEASSLMPTI
jgi:hypothetical protein